ncbi:MAG: hypothetical protein ABIQ93_05200 [Saprospiraceae bacterium]
MNPIERHPEYDELEKHLQANLDDYAPEAPDRLWAGIELRLPKQRRRPVLWWWLLPSVLLFRVDDGFNPAHTPNVPSAAVASALQLNQAAYPISVSLPDGAMEKGFPVSGSADFQTAMPATTAAKTEIVTGATVPEKAAIEILPVAAPQVDNRLAKSGNPSLLEILSTKEIARLKNENPGLPKIDFPLKQPHKQQWQISVVAAPIWIWQPAVGADMHHGGQMTFAEHHQGPATGWQKGLSIGYKLGSHWLLTAGLSQRRSIQISAHTATLRLMDGTCLNAYDPGPKEYEFQYALQSGVSQSNVTVRIAQVDSISTMPVDEPFMLNMRTMRQTADWVLPFTVQREFGRGRWKGFVQGGGQLNLPARMEVRVDHFAEACVDLCFAGGRMPTLRVAERGKTSFAWLLGTGLNYGMTPHWALSVAPTVVGQKGRMEFALNAGLTLKI